jgi:Flp pilus assembly pilin Flp
VRGLVNFIGKAVGVFRCRKGQTAIEYALVAILIAIVLALAFKNAHVECGISTAASKVQCTLETPP